MTVDLNKHIELRAKRDGRERPFIQGTRIEVAYIVADHEFRGMTPDEIADGFPHINLADIHAALAFYHDNREEVRRMMREDSELVDSYRVAQESVQ